MWNFRLYRLIHDKRLTTSFLRKFHEEFTQPELLLQKQKKEEELKQKAVNNKDDRTKLDHLPAGAVRQKYKVFRDEESTEIFDVEEERERYRYQIQDEPEEILDDAYIGLNLKRGEHGVFDIEDLVNVLRKENAEDIFVCSVPKELKYVDYLVVCSGRSYRHMLATAEFVRHMYKVKRTKNDKLPKIEGEKSRDWMALDLGNIALHIFSPTAREEYDLESLWAVGAEYDNESNKPDDPLVELLSKYSSLQFEAKTKEN